MSKDYAKPASDESIQTAKKSLEDHGFTVEVVDNLEDAKQFVLGEIPEGSEVFTATSVTLNETGLTETLNSDKYISVRKKFEPLARNPETKLESRRIGSGAQYALGSVHAVTEDGQVMVASNTGSQLPSYAYGADHVIWVVGAQKIVKDLDQAFDRLETYTYPLENERAKKAYGFPTLISKVLIYREDPPHRVTIVVVKESVGY